MLWWISVQHDENVCFGKWAKQTSKIQFSFILFSFFIWFLRSTALFKSNVQSRFLVRCYFKASLMMFSFQRIWKWNSLGLVAFHAVLWSMALSCFFLLLSTFFFITIPSVLFRDSMMKKQTEHLPCSNVRWRGKNEKTKKK